MNYRRRKCEALGIDRAEMPGLLEEMSEPQNAPAVFQAAYETKPELGFFLFESLSNGLSYEKLQGCLRKEAHMAIPITKCAFYGYRRIAMSIYKNEYKNEFKQ